MIDKKTLLKKGLVLLVGFLLVSIIFLKDGTIVGSGENQTDIRSEVGLWTPGTSIEQTFVASQENLCRIDFAVDSYYPWDSPYLDCYLFEIETHENPDELSYEFISQHVKEVRSARINGWTISGHMFNSFSFAPIADSQNKRYLFSIQSPGLKNGGTSILLASSRDRYDYGNLFVDGERKSRDLGFRALYGRSGLTLFQEGVDIFVLQKSFPFSTPVSYYILCGIYILLMFVFLLLL